MSLLSAAFLLPSSPSRGAEYELIWKGRPVSLKLQHHTHAKDCSSGRDQRASQTTSFVGRASLGGGEYQQQSFTSFAHAYKQHSQAPAAFQTGPALASQKFPTHLQIVQPRCRPKAPRPLYRLQYLFCGYCISNHPSPPVLRVTFAQQPFAIAATKREGHFAGRRSA